MNEARILTVGDSALVVELGKGQDLDASVNARAVAIAAAVQAAGIAGVLDVVPTFQTVGVYFDPLKTNVDALAALLHSLAESQTPVASPAVTVHRVPVCYGGVFGPDLAEIATRAHLSEEAVVALHAEPIYRVFMLGFTPGFAYLGSVAPAIAFPRRATPRATVPAGSVAIAGNQTGIYPSASPGGWHIIGRTSVRPFDPGRTSPFLFNSGDSIQFHAIEPAAFEGRE